MPAVLDDWISFSDRTHTIYVEVYQTWFLFCYVVRHTFYENLSKNDSYSHWKTHSTFNILNRYLYLPPKSKVNKEKNLNRHSCAGEKWHRWHSQKKEEKIVGKQELEKFNFTFSFSQVLKQNHLIKFSLFVHTFMMISYTSISSSLIYKSSLKTQISSV